MIKNKLNCVFFLSIKMFSFSEYSIYIFFLTSLLYPLSVVAWSFKKKLVLHTSVRTPDDFSIHMIPTAIIIIVLHALQHVVQLFALMHLNVAVLANFLTFWKLKSDTKRKQNHEKHPQFNNNNIIAKLFVSLVQGQHMRK